ncbi:MAG: hypothetical protein HYR60_18350 [Acidobacteria bacterium]|nr:hypothetical protein [Acidobacteriota bacterium]
MHEYKQALKKFPSIKNDLTESFKALEKNAELGDAIPGYARAVWKLRIGVKGHFGKRGGYRLIYHFDVERAVITPLALYFKADIPDLPRDEIAKRLQEVAKVIGTPTPPSTTSSSN